MKVDREARLVPLFKGQEDEKESAKETKMERSWRQEEKKESFESTNKAFQGQCDQLCHMLLTELRDMQTKLLH